MVSLAAHLLPHVVLNLNKFRLPLFRLFFGIPSQEVQYRLQDQ